MTMTELHELTIFSDLDSGQVDAVASAVDGERRPREGEVICAEGETATDWWIVGDGFADVTAAGIYLGTLGPGETIGELSLLDGSPRAATVTARSDMRLFRVPGAVFAETMAATPGLALGIARQLAVRLRLSNALVAATRGSSSIPPVSSVEQWQDEHSHETSADRTSFDVSAPGYFDDPTVQLGAIREQEAVHFIEATGGYLVTRYDDVFRLARDKAMSVDPVHAKPTPSIQMELDARKVDPTFGRSMLTRDGDDHTRLRRLVSKAFTPRAIERWRDRAAEVTDGLLGRFEEAGGGDVINDFALLLPVQMISEMLGMPTDDIPLLKQWSSDVAKILDPIRTDEEMQRGTAAVAAMSEYIEAIHREKSKNPGDDIFSALIAAEEDGQRLTRDEISANVRLLYIAGHETTTNLIGNGLVELFRHESEMAKLRSDQSLDANLIEEVLRYNSPVQFTRRITTEDITVSDATTSDTTRSDTTRSDTTIPAGSVVMLCAASANRDPRKWGPTHDEFLIDRVGANEQLSFGGGAHFCLGAALARLEGQIALPRIVRRFPNLAPVDESPTFGTRLVLRGCPNLMVTTR